MGEKERAGQFFDEGGKGERAGGAKEKEKARPGKSGGAGGRGKKEKKRADGFSVGAGGFRRWRRGRGGGRRPFLFLGRRKRAGGFSVETGGKRRRPGREKAAGWASLLSELFCPGAERKAKDGSRKRNADPNQKSRVPSLFFRKKGDAVNRDRTPDIGAGIQQSGHERDFAVFPEFRRHHAGHDPVDTVHATGQNGRQGNGKNRRDSVCNIQQQACKTPERENQPGKQHLVFHDFFIQKSRGLRDQNAENRQNNAGQYGNLVIQCKGFADIGRHPGGHAVSQNSLHGDCNQQKSDENADPARHPDVLRRDGPFRFVLPGDGRAFAPDNGHHHRAGGRGEKHRFPSGKTD